LGEIAVEKACDESGAKRALILPVGGAFHSNDGTSKRRVRSG
jgi:hypothetical protein